MSTREAILAPQMTDEEFSTHVMEILTRELGDVGVARFLTISRRPLGTGDYTRDRHKWQKGMTVSQIMENIKKNREATT